jgi:hypothetical protein
LHFINALLAILNTMKAVPVRVWDIHYLIVCIYALILMIFLKAYQNCDNLLINIILLN